MKPSQKGKKPGIRQLIQENPAEAIRKFGKLLSHAEFLTCAKKEPAAAAKYVPERITPEQIKEWSHHDPRICLTTLPGETPIEQLMEIVSAFRTTSLTLLKSREGNPLAKALVPLLEQIGKTDHELHDAITKNLASGI